LFRVAFGVAVSMLHVPAGCAHSTRILTAKMLRLRRGQFRATILYSFGHLLISPVRPPSSDPAPIHHLEIRRTLNEEYFRRKPQLQCS
jgi:hypothetical protein